jgi:sialate O-acetylesterase
MKARFTILILIMLAATTARPADWTRIADLKGLWSFSVGDDMQWADPAYDHSSWDRLYVPAYWEDYYEGYNGYGWYRRSFDVRSLPANGPLVVMLGQIDDVDEVYINGVKVGQTGEFFPAYTTAYDLNRVYYLPEGLLKAENNLIAVRVFDEGGPGGLIRGNNIGIFYDNDFSLLEYDLSGEWKFTTLRERGILNAGYDDSHWDQIAVPANWDNQGYANHDGFGWYRHRFQLPASLINEELYLVLGKVDDFDKVYLNGDLIGRTEYLDEYSRYSKGAAWRLYRVYRIPRNQLKRENVLVVEVRDEQLGGGIYEGPVGLINARNANIILERNVGDFWDDPVRAILRYFEF